MNDINIILGIINFGLILLSYVLFGYFYVLSIQPVKRQEKHGEKAWDNCKRLRLVASFFEFIVVINLVLWIWLPLPIVDSWVISPNFWAGVVIAFIIAIPCCLLMFLGLKAAGSESLTPSKETNMYEGIYRYIRHPQTLGEFPLFVAICFGVNSWFLVIVSTLFIVIYVPIMIHYEEMDLIRRFGEKYRNYQKTTGVLFPKLRKTS